jgi:hypothetical protein
MSILPTIIRELQVIADLTAGQKLQLTEDTTAARRLFTGAIETTFTPSVGSNGSLLQAAGRYITGADRPETLDRLQRLVPEWIRGATEALTSSGEEEKGALAALLVKTHTGLTHLKEAHERSVETAWAAVVSGIIDTFEATAGPHIRKARTEAKAAHYLRELEPFLSLQPGEKVQRLAETTAARQVQQIEATRIIHSLGNNQTLLGAPLQRVARLIVGADTQESALQFSREFQMLLGEIRTFMSTLDDGAIRRDLMDKLMQVRTSFLILRTTHVPNYHKELEPGNDPSIEDHDLVWAHVAHGLYKSIKATFAEEQRRPDTGASASAAAAAPVATPSDAQLVGLLRGVNQELAPSLGGSLVLPEVRIPDAHRTAFETNLRLLQMGDLEQEGSDLPAFTARKYGEAKALVEKHDPSRQRGTNYNAWRQDQFANLHGFFSRLQQGLLALRGEVTAQNVANLLMNPRYPYFAKELLAYEKLLLIVRDDTAAQSKQEYPELMNTLQVVSLLKVELRKILEKVLPALV